MVMINKIINTIKKIIVNFLRRILVLKDNSWYNVTSLILSNLLSILLWKFLYKLNKYFINK